MFSEVDNTSVKLSQYPVILSDENIQVLERFVVLMYDRCSAATNVNEASLDQFPHKQRIYESVSLTRVVWAQATDPQPDIVSY